MYRQIANETVTKKDGSTESVVIQGIYRKSDNAFIPFNTANRDYQDYLAWVADGNTADPAS